MKAVKVGLIALVILAALAFFGLRHQTVASRKTDPSGNFTAITSYRTYLSLLPMPPGSSSDKACFVKIVDKAGQYYGEIPVPMLLLASVEWTDGGANIKLVGEWDLKKKICYYWSDDGNRKIYVKTGD